MGYVLLSCGDYEDKFRVIHSNCTKDTSSWTDLTSIHGQFMLWACYHRFFGLLDSGGTLLSPFR